MFVFLGKHIDREKKRKNPKKHDTFGNFMLSENSGKIMTNCRKMRAICLFVPENIKCMSKCQNNISKVKHIEMNISAGTEPSTA